MATRTLDVRPPLVIGALIGEAAVRRAYPGGFARFALVAQLHGIEVNMGRLVDTNDCHVRSYARWRVGRGETRRCPHGELYLRVREGGS